MHRRFLFTVVALLTCAGCRNEGLTREQAGESVEETQLAVQASALTGNTIEITTNFTIGQAVEQAAEELRSFYASQLPCAEVTLDGHTLTVEYGKTSSVCLYRGQVITGTHAVTIERNEEGQVHVDHIWLELSNQIMTVSGTANVTWQGGEDPSRHVEHELVWTRLSDGRTGTGTANLTQRPLAEGIETGFVEQGERTWIGKSGDWLLDIDDVEVRWIDPVPQAGSYALGTPFDEDLRLTFRRIDDVTIRVTAATDERSYDIDVKRAGATGGE
jgi:hypothetical protein